MVVDGNFRPSKITVGDRNFGPSEIMVGDHNFGTSKITILLLFLQDEIFITVGPWLMKLFTTPPSILTLVTWVHRTQAWP